MYHEENQRIPAHSAALKETIQVGATALAVFICDEQAQGGAGAPTHVSRRKPENCCAFGSLKKQKKVGATNVAPT
ncbi:hypothetical protein K8O68_08850 [Salipaludibacillus sp. CUR1]|uniref:hypothetical protein n=1 Tax=Salipaludibacillus sp. CUR1 TaxID=2820003 RepID=UPI001E58F866|nr:hypothetical protein [Salipaludibacillus sp. CUR1]MCE7792523.1 hypothetical protein [Salipaludibacillus sp. CUR1]